MKTHPQGQSHGGFTLVEIMIVVAIITILATIGVPNYLRARKRSQATRILEELRMLGGAIDQYAVEHNRMGSAVIGPSDVDYLRPYIKTGSALYESLPNDLLGNPFGLTTIDTPPRISTATFNALVDVAPVDFWSPYNP
jgi:prepilin-type N-terminal cleavage/methylation domain-containing protein